MGDVIPINTTRTMWADKRERPDETARGNAIRFKKKVTQPRKPDPLCIRNRPSRITCLRVYHRWDSWSMTFFFPSSILVTFQVEDKNSS